MTVRRAFLGVVVAAFAVIALAAFASFIEFFAYPAEALLTGVGAFVRVAPWLVPTAIGVAWVLPRLAKSGSTLAVVGKCALLAIPVAVCAFVGQFALELVVPSPQDYIVVVNDVVANKRGPEVAAVSMAIGALLYSPFWLVATGLVVSAREKRSEAPA